MVFVDLKIRIKETTEQRDNAKKKSLTCKDQIKIILKYILLLNFLNNDLIMFLHWGQ